MELHVKGSHHLAHEAQSSYKRRISSLPSYSSKWGRAVPHAEHPLAAELMPWVASWSCPQAQVQSPVSDASSASSQAHDLSRSFHLPEPQFPKLYRRIAAPPSQDVCKD